MSDFCKRCGHSFDDHIVEDDNSYCVGGPISLGAYGGREDPCACRCKKFLTEDERDKFVADEIRAGRCPFGELQPGQTMAHCPLGFPGCGCADELMENPYLQPDSEKYLEPGAGS